MHKRSASTRHNTEHISLDFLMEQMNEKEGGGERVTNNVIKRLGREDGAQKFAPTRVELIRAIEKLPPGYKYAFIMHDIEGYGLQEIAEMTGATIGNYKSQLWKARRKLRDLLLGKKPKSKHPGRALTFPVKPLEASVN